MKAQMEALEIPVEVCVLRDGQPLMTQVFQHTPIRFGRILDNDIVLPFESVSRHHCELHFQNGRWTLQDLKSLNGVVVNGERVASATFESLGEFDLKPVHVLLKVVKPLAETITSHVPAEKTEVVSMSDATLVGDAPTPSSPREHSFYDAPQAPLVKPPLLNIHGTALMAFPHPKAESSKSRSVQVTVVWHEVLLSVDEFLPGEDMMIEINGFFLKLGHVGRERSDLRCPKGTTFLDRAGNDSTLVPNSPATWMAGDGLRILARYVPSSKQVATNLLPFIDGDLIDPLLASGAVHGVMAVAAMTMSVKTPAPPKAAPERIAKIITTPLAQPTPPPMIAAATPTPAPIVATPTPRPKPIAVATPVPKIVEKTVKRPVAVKSPPKVESVERKLVKAEPQPKSEAPPKPVVAKEVAVVKPQPTPKPFNASSVGALKALSMLSSAPVPAASHSERIIIRKTAGTENDSATSPNPTTSKLMSNLPVASANPNGTSTDMTLPVSTKGAGYGTTGFNGKTGKRGVLGSVIGGATYTELTKNEGLTREQVMKVVQNHQTQIQQCYERGLMDDSSLAGRAEFEWEISAKGSVVANSVKVKETSLKNGEKLIDCVKKIFRSMNFPSAKNGSSTTPTIGLPFGRL